VTGYQIAVTPSIAGSLLRYIKKRLNELCEGMQVRQRAKGYEYWLGLRLVIGLALVRSGLGRGLGS